jgi:hypothetical protein
MTVQFSPQAIIAHSTSPPRHGRPGFPSCQITADDLIEQIAPHPLHAEADWVSGEDMATSPPFDGHR